MRVRCGPCGNDVKRRSATKHLMACAETRRCLVYVPGRTCGDGGCPGPEEYFWCPSASATWASNMYRANPAFAVCVGKREPRRVTFGTDT